MLTATPAAPTLRHPRAKKSLAQNFLIDRRIVGRIIAAAEIDPADAVVEIGPGRGILTRPLAAAAGSLVAVELDAALASALSAEFAAHPTVRILHSDARTVGIDALGVEGKPYKLVANLPYYAAMPIVRRFLELAQKPSRLVVMMQREVARSMTALPGDMSLLSVATQIYGKARIVATVPPRAFRPAPKVTSAVVRIDTLPRPALDLDSVDAFFTLVRGGFSAPRKQLRNCLQLGLRIEREQARALLDAADIDFRRRPQTLSIDEWGWLYAAYRQSPAAERADADA